MEKNTTSFPGKERALGTRLRRFGSFLVSPTDGIRFKPFNSWIRNRIFAIALALHKLTSTFYVIITHTCNYDYSLGNFRKFQFNVSESNEPVRSKWPGEWDAFLKKNKNKACLNSPFFFRNFWLQLNMWFPNYDSIPIQVNFHRLTSSYARLSVHCTQTSALLYILFKIQSALSKTDKLRDCRCATLRLVLQPEDS